MKTAGNTVINGRLVPRIGLRTSRRATPARVATMAHAYGRSRSSSDAGSFGTSDGEPAGQVIDLSGQGLELTPETVETARNRLPEYLVSQFQNRAARLRRPCAHT